MRRIIFFIIIIVCALSIAHSVSSIYSLWKKQDLLVKTRLELKKEQEENQKLKTELKVVSTQQFVEEEARNKLFLTKPGENTVIIPPELLAIPSPTPTPTPASTVEQWLRLFF